MLFDEARFLEAILSLQDRLVLKNTLLLKETQWINIVAYQ